MPLYEYECEACGYRFEVIQRFSDPALEHCRQCNGPVHKLLSAPAIQFKGSGWYVTDYARKGAAESEPSATGATSGGSAPSSGPDKTASGSPGGGTPPSSTPPSTS